MKRRRWVPILTGLLVLIAVAALLLYPVRTTGIRVGILGGSLLLALHVIALTWRRRHIGKGLLVMLIAMGGWTAATWSAVAPSPEGFTAALIQYDGTPYVWGGETRRGIDCSGLIRMALRDALVLEGRPGAVLRLWLADAAARDFAVSYAAILRPCGEAPSIQGLDPGRLAPGAIAVTANGVHTLAFLGGNRWIQASPEDQRVTIRPASDSDPWFRRPVLLYELRTAGGGSPGTGLSPFNAPLSGDRPNLIAAAFPPPVVLRGGTWEVDP